MSGGFKKQQAIYEQIADTICERILQGTLEEDGKISSIRETAITMEVNPNTVQRAYEWLQQQEIIYTKRGRGYFVNSGAMEKVKQTKKEQLINEVLPDFFKSLQLLQITPEEVLTKYQKFLKGKTS